MSARATKLAAPRAVKIQKDEAVASLAEWYGAAITNLAAELRPRFEAGELRGYSNVDVRAEEGVAIETPRGYWKKRIPLFILESICERRLAQTTRDAALVLAASPSTESYPSLDGGSAPVTYLASEVAAWDVLRYALERGWYRPDAKEEERPSAADLRRAALRVA